MLDRLRDRIAEIVRYAPGRLVGCGCAILGLAVILLMIALGIGNLVPAGTPAPGTPGPTLPPFTATPGTTTPPPAAATPGPFPPAVACVTDGSDIVVSDPDMAAASWSATQSSGGAMVAEYAVGPTAGERDVTIRFGGAPGSLAVFHLWGVSSYDPGVVWPDHGLRDRRPGPDPRQQCRRGPSARLARPPAGRLALLGRPADADRRAGLGPILDRRRG